MLELNHQGKAALVKNCKPICEPSPKDFYNDDILRCDIIKFLLSQIASTLIKDNNKSFGLSYTGNSCLLKP